MTTHNAFRGLSQTLLALLEQPLADIRDRHLRKPALEHATLAPVWVMPMIRCADPPGV